MKRAIIYLLLLVVINLLGDFIIHNTFDPFHKTSGLINYIIIFLISVFYYCGNISGYKILRLFLGPVTFLLISLLFIFLELLSQGIESPAELLYIIVSLISSFFEIINFIIGEVNNELIRKCLFYIFNSIGVSIILVGIAAFVDFLDNKIKGNKTKS